MNCLGLGKLPGGPWIIQGSSLTLLGNCRAPWGALGNSRELPGGSGSSLKSSGNLLGELPGELCGPPRGARAAPEASHTRYVYK